MQRLLIVPLLSLIAVVHCFAQVSLCPLFSDNMVLQRNMEAVPIWGHGQAGRIVKITTSWDAQTYVAKVDKDGQWRTAVKTPDAGGPYTITVSDGKKKTTLENVMMGEVWLCSGQSNMEMPIEGWGKVSNYKEEESKANDYPNIRLCSVERGTSTTPLDELSIVGNSWQVCDSASVENFSATAYFFGRALNEHYNIPIGLIKSAWGGTIIEAWMSQQAFENIPQQEANLKAVASLPESSEEREALYDEQYEEWLGKTNEVIARDEGNIAQYTSPSFDDTAWDDIFLPSLGSADGTVNSVWWARRVVDIPESWAGRELTLSLGKVDDNDVTYFNGIPVGNTVGSTLTRVYQIPAECVKAGRAVVAIRIHDTGGLSGVDCAVNLFCLSLPDTDEKLSLVGTWKRHTSVNSSSLPPIPVNTSIDPNVHTLLYNAMINPIVPYAIRGVIWYQGENNVSQAYQYRDLMPMMIHDWRGKWGVEFPFIMVQLANYMQRVDHPQESAWAELREAQLKTRLVMDGVGMVTTIDIGDANDIHPKNKQEVGRRLSLVARDLAYGEHLVCEGPLYSGYRIENDKIRIMFSSSSSGGMTSSDGGVLKGFEVAGADHVWHEADAEVSSVGVVVSSREVAFPLAVRYAWADNPECNLVNATGLPASPFRTDDWEGVSYGNVR